MKITRLMRSKTMKQKNVNQEISKLKKRISKLEEINSYLFDYIEELKYDNEKLSENEYYMREFIYYHRLTEAYNYFKENAYEIPDSEDPDIPFTHLVL